MPQLLQALPPAPSSREPTRRVSQARVLPLRRAAEERAMGRPAFARIGESRHRRLIAWCCIAVVLVLFAACGGGSESAGTPPAESASPSGSVQPGELPSELLLAEPRTEVGTSLIGLAWSTEGGFTGSIVAQVEQEPSFTPSAAFTLQSNGPAADFGAH
jgi:hypothetical protein